jgi:hypothetical protein
MGTGRNTAALDKSIVRDLIEISLIEEYGWTPEYISTLSYKWIQRHNFIKRIKSQASENKRVQEKIMAEAKAQSRR